MIGFWLARVGGRSILHSERKLGDPSYLSVYGGVGFLFLVSGGNVNKIDYISSFASRRSSGYKDYLFTNVDARIAGSVAGRTGLGERRKSR